MRKMKGLIVVLVLVGVVGLLFSCSNASNLEKTALPVVNDILANYYGEGNFSEAIDVKLGEEFASDRYRATATLSNGNTLSLAIEDRGDEIYVELAEW